jgi:general secretion pathway protein G
VSSRGPSNTRDSGYTFIEIAIVAAIIAILASAIMPLAKVTMQREREFELRRQLREMRTAIDKFKDAVDQGKIAPADLPGNSDGYPATLDMLVDGVQAAPAAGAGAGAGAGATTAPGDTSIKKLKFLRRIPIDPMTKGKDWGKRSSRDLATSKTWGGQNVFDVYSTSEGHALDGTKYSDW